MADEKFADEKLTDDELDGVVGGGTMQTIGDSNFLSNRNLIHGQAVDFLSIAFNWNNISKNVDDGWARVGVTCCTVFGSGDNKYWIGGREVSRKEAFAHVLRQQGCSESQIANFDYGGYAGAF